MFVLRFYRKQRSGRQASEEFETCLWVVLVRVDENVLRSWGIQQPELDLTDEVHTDDSRKFVSVKGLEEILGVDSHWVLSSDFLKGEEKFERVPAIREVNSLGFESFVLLVAFPELESLVKN